MFATHDDVLNWARAIAYEICFVAVIMRSDTNTGMRGRYDESAWGGPVARSVQTGGAYSPIQRDASAEP